MYNRDKPVKKAAEEKAQDKEMDALLDRRIELLAAPASPQNDRDQDEWERQALAHMRRKADEKTLGEDIG